MKYFITGSPGASLKDRFERYLLEVYGYSCKTNDHIKMCGKLLGNCIAYVKRSGLLAQLLPTS